MRKGVKTTTLRAVVGACIFCSLGPIGTAVGQSGTGLPLPSLNTQAQITAGPDHSLWFTNANYGLVGRITTAGVVTDLRRSCYPALLVPCRDSRGRRRRHVVPRGGWWPDRAPYYQR